MRGNVRSQTILGIAGLIVSIAAIYFPIAVARDLPPFRDSSPSTKTPTPVATPITPEPPITPDAITPPATTTPATVTPTPAVGIGDVDHCSGVQVKVSTVTHQDGSLRVPIAVSNPESGETIILPPVDLVFLIDEAGNQYSIDRFPQLSNGEWGLGTRVLPGATFNGVLLYNGSPTGGRMARVEVTDIRRAANQFATCSVDVENILLP